MRILVLIICLVTTVPLSAQRANQHFSGALEFGLGWGHVIDFTLDNNNITSKFLFQRLFNLPWMVGIHTQRELSSDSYMEFGLLFHKRSSDWVYQRSIYNEFGSYSYRSTNMVLALNCVDFSMKYYKFLKYWKNRELYAFGGIVPVWVLNVPSSSDLSINSVPQDLFRSWNLALAWGLALEKGNIRWKLHFDLAVISVVNSEYAFEIPEEERAWGPQAYPFEVLLCCAYLIR